MSLLLAIHSFMKSRVWSALSKLLNPESALSVCIECTVELFLEFSEKTMSLRNLKISTKRALSRCIECIGEDRVIKVFCRRSLLGGH
jgi:hypothetical protein